MYVVGAVNPREVTESEKIPRLSVKFILLYQIDFTF